MCGIFEKPTTRMKELKSLLETYKNAVFEKDLIAFLALFDEQVRIFDMWGEWSYEGLPAWRKMVNSWFSSLGADHDRLIFEEVDYLVEGDLATITAFARFAAISAQEEELRFLHNRLTLIVRKKTELGGDTGIWKIIHQHTSVPVDGATMKIKLKRE
jgi:ketosteroid isomerase-like protein